jgi:ATP-dependent protease HslVU (ClpYQ), ATPase subunit
VTLDFAPDAIDALADLAAEINGSIENIGRGACIRCWNACWRRSASAPPTRAGEQITIDAAYVQERVAPLARNTDLSKFIL